MSSVPPPSSSSSPPVSVSVGSPPDSPPIRNPIHTNDLEDIVLSPLSPDAHEDHEEFDIKEDAPHSSPSENSSNSLYSSNGPLPLSSLFPTNTSWMDVPFLLIPIILFSLAIPLSVSFFKFSPHLSSVLGAFSLSALLGFLGISIITFALLRMPTSLRTFSVAIPLVVIPLSIILFFAQFHSYDVGGAVIGVTIFVGFVTRLAMNSPDTPEEEDDGEAEGRGKSKRKSPKEMPSDYLPLFTFSSVFFENFLSLVMSSTIHRDLIIRFVLGISVIYGAFLIWWMAFVTSIFQYSQTEEGLTYVSTVRLSYVLASLVLYFFNGIFKSSIMCLMGLMNFSFYVGNPQHSKGLTAMFILRRLLLSSFPTLCCAGLWYGVIEFLRYFRWTLRVLSSAAENSANDDEGNGDAKKKRRKKKSDADDSSCCYRCVCSSLSCVFRTLWNVLIWALSALLNPIFSLFSKGISFATLPVALANHIVTGNSLYSSCNPNILSQRNVSSIVHCAFDYPVEGELLAFCGCIISGVLMSAFSSALNVFADSSTSLSLSHAALILITMMLCYSLYSCVSLCLSSLCLQIPFILLGCPAPLIALHPSEWEVFEKEIQSKWRLEWINEDGKWRPLGETARRKGKKSVGAWGDPSEDEETVFNSRDGEKAIEMEAHGEVKGNPSIAWGGQQKYTRV